MKRARFLLLTSLLVCSLSHAAVLHVSAEATVNGDGTEAHPFSSIQAAANAVKPGDTVIVGPGVYYEFVRITRFGTREAPITFKADKIQKNRVIITGARKDVRTGQQKWELHDKETLTYRIPHTVADTSRVLYDGVDLFPYKSLEALKSFYAQPGRPGPKHGFAYEDGFLYVRLRTDGKYGSTDPNKHVMAVSPTFNNRSPWPSTSKGYNLSLLDRNKGSIHIRLEGFTFETPGYAGIFVNGSDSVIRNCFFHGTVVGIRGRDDKGCANTLIEHCDWHNFPVFDDAAELLDDFVNQRREVSKEHQSYPFWVHKNGYSCSVPYEAGFLNHVGYQWTIRNCHIHDAFEGVCNLYHGNGTVFEDNLWERLLDNAIELEDHAANTTIRRNLFKDIAQPISLQPLDGLPWPGPTYVYQNLFCYSNPPLFPVKFIASFKLGAPNHRFKSKKYQEQKLDDSNVELPGDGLMIFNNTIVTPSARLIGWTTTSRQYLHKVTLANNLVIANCLESSSWLNPASGVPDKLDERLRQIEEHPRQLWGFDYINNQFAWLHQTIPAPNPVKEQTHSAEKLITGWEKNSFTPVAFTPSAPISNAPASFPFVGAMQTKEDAFAQHTGVQEE